MTKKNDQVVHIDLAEKQPELPEFDGEGKCPKCGSFVEFGYGLMGGGYGPYTFCPVCAEIVSKSIEDDA